MELRQALGLVGHIRVIEVNHGANGFHPHFHLALFIGGNVHLDDLEAVMARAFGRWTRAVVKSGGKTPTEQCQDVRLFGASDADSLAEYLSKTLLEPVRSGSGSARVRADRTSPDGLGLALGKELTQGQRKVARKAYGTRPARALLADACDDGDADSLALWQEYERATKGLRSISWSRGLRAKYGLGVERSEQEIVDDDRGGVAVMRLTESGLARIIGWPELVPAMREAYADSDFAGLQNFMNTNGIGYEEITEGV
jgi:hypothetical protein